MMKPAIDVSYSCLGHPSLNIVQSVSKVLNLEFNMNRILGVCASYQ